MLARSLLLISPRRGCLWHSPAQLPSPPGCPSSQPLVALPHPCPGARLCPLWLNFFPCTSGVLLFQQVIQEKGIPLEIADGEAAGLGGEAVGPCEACTLHPGWGIGFGAGIDIEGEAYCEKDSAGQEWFETLDEVVLLGGAETDPEEVGAEGLKFLDDFGLVLQRAFGVAVSMV